ncbi:MAG: phospho-N-acetylmuramoyl-pentapeptide-transferase [Clostridia bacterium]|nr:phospho-N-acetylmuramoyl-pentapeptide-transferase [Clostridia bacterium]
MNYLIAAAVAFAISAAIAPLVLPILRKLKFGQEIREEGPSWHEKKSGTPTMGGIIFIAGIAVSAIVMLSHSFKGIMLLYLSLSFGLIGFIDDYIKVVKKRNLGLTEIQKLMLQLVASLLFIWVLYKNGLVDTTLKIPFTNIAPDLGLWYIPFAVVVIIGSVNAVNLTDGIDGLATSVTIIVCLFFAAAMNLISDHETGLFAISVVGGLTGFLLYNKPKALVFMGDTGSLFLGGVVSAVAVSCGMSLFLVIAGLIYVIEALSVILQVTSFKLTGKRIFKMSPIHHHFEMCGWSEIKIDLIFSAATAILCIIAYAGLRV